MEPSKKLPLTSQDFKPSSHLTERCLGKAGVLPRQNS
jgi:hypothetical protein